MRHSSVLTVVTSALVGLYMSMSAASAATLDFAFSFNNELNGGGAVTGIIRGLTDNMTGSATSVEVLTNTTGLGIGEYVGSPLTNSWTVTGGSITAFDFLSAGVLNSIPAVTDALLFLDSTELSGASFRAGIADSPGPFVTGSGFVSTEDIDLTFTAIDATAVPLPAGGLLLIAGLFGLAITRNVSRR